MPVPNRVSPTTLSRATGSISTPSTTRQKSPKTNNTSSPRACRRRPRDVPWFYQGVAEIWLADEATQLASLQSPEFLQGARADEPRWAAFRRTLIEDRAGLAKRFGFDRHLVGFSRDPLYALGEPAFDAVECVSLRDPAALEALLADGGFTAALTARPYVHETYAFNFVARERWIIPPGVR